MAPLSSLTMPMLPSLPSFKSPRLRVRRCSKNPSSRLLFGFLVFSRFLPIPSLKDRTSAFAGGAETLGIEGFLGENDLISRHFVVAEVYDSFMKPSLCFYVEIFRQTVLLVNIS